MNFILDSNSTATPDGGFLVLNDVTVNGCPETYRAYVLFYDTEVSGGGFSVIRSDNGGDGSYFQAFTQGAQLFTGTKAKPVFSPGVFGLDGFRGLPGGVLTITPYAGPVPEPATWAMMVAGFGAVGYALRRREKVTAKVRFA